MKAVQLSTADFTKLRDLLGSDIKPCSWVFEMSEEQLTEARRLMAEARIDDCFNYLKEQYEPPTSNRQVP